MKRNLPLLIIILLAGTLLAACNEADPSPAPTATTLPPTAAALETAVATALPQPTVDGTRPAPLAGTPFIDDENLYGGRYALIGFMNDVENLGVPPAEVWIPVTAVDNADESRTYQYTAVGDAGEYTLYLTAPTTPGQSYFYKMRLEGPDDFFYEAEMQADGTIAVSQ